MSRFSSLGGDVPFRMPHVDEMILEGIRRRFARGECLTAYEIERYSSAVPVGELVMWQGRYNQQAERERTAMLAFRSALRRHGRRARADKPRKVIR